MDLAFPEYGRLKSVLMHSPGEEIDRIKPATFRKFLFEDAIEPGEFRRQHARLVDVLRGQGVEVRLVGDALTGPGFLRSIRSCPNLVYMRDTVAVTRAGWISMRMRSPVRGREPRIAAAALERLGIRKLARISAPGTMEGGDLMFLDGHTLLVGVGNRSSRSGLEQLRTAAREERLDTIVAVQLPRWAIHLDGTMVIVDRDLAIVHRESVDRPATVLESGRTPRRTNLLAFLKRRGFRFVEVTLNERQRRATNVITLGPRKLVGYAGNARVRKLLADEGVEYIEIEGSELVRGGGGPRCMTAPIDREGAP